MHFTKMQGLGNDYIYVNGMQEKIKDPRTLAIRLSNRHFGIGADGLIVIRASKVADVQMDMYNADGSRGNVWKRDSMCGEICV